LKKLINNFRLPVIALCNAFRTHGKEGEKTLGESGKNNHQYIHTGLKSEGGGGVRRREQPRARGRKRVRIEFDQQGGATVEKKGKQNIRRKMQLKGRRNTEIK
jgi:hypothetical protein